MQDYYGMTEKEYFDEMFGEDFMNSNNKGSLIEYPEEEEYVQMWRNSLTINQINSI